MSDKEKILESLSPNERKILHLLKEQDFKKLGKDAGLDETSLLRALQFLENKGILKLSSEKTQSIDLDVNGILYKRKGLPERRLLEALSEKNNLGLEEAQKLSGLNENEFKASLGVLKSKAVVNLVNGKIMLQERTEEITRKSIEERFLEILPLHLDKLLPEQKLAFENLRKRKNIILVKDEKEVHFKLTELGKEIIASNLHMDGKNLIEVLTPEILRNESWKGKKFRRYDIKSPVSQISGGKKHFVSQAIEYAKRVWTDMGFKEMDSSLTQTGFWNFDALFTAQDHPVRELQDTFYLKGKGKLPEKKIVQAVKQAHEEGIGGSKGWKYSWNEEEASRVLLRTHTTCISAKTLAMLRDLKDKQGKFFAIGKCFRNETLDWSHGFEFNQTEGIVVDKNANFRHLLGYLKEFFNKMGFEDIKFIPSYFPYTEPSVEIYGYLKEKKKWIEIGGAGIFRPEVVIPLLGEYIPVLAWGPGFDRTLMDYYKIQDLRQFYNNDLEHLRKIKFWMK